MIGDLTPVEHAVAAILHLHNRTEDPRREKKQRLGIPILETDFPDYCEHCYRIAHSGWTEFFDETPWYWPCETVRVIREHIG